MSNARVMADRLAGLLARERGCMAELVEALAEFDRQQAWADLGHATNFFGPQVGYPHRSATKRFAIASDIALPFVFGRRDRSRSPSMPPASNTG